MGPFKINHLDHVAIRVKNTETSKEWYRKTLGLKAYVKKEWEGVPIFMMAGTTGVALFPANQADPELNLNSKNVKIDHFAFNVEKQEFDKARKYLESIGEDYYFEDHIFFHSIYLRDPDNHTVELTTIVVSEEEFFK